MKHSEILKKAKKRLWNGKVESEQYNGKERYVCFTIEDVAKKHSDEETKENAKAILKLIRKRLGITHDGCDTTLPIEDWIESQGFDIKLVSDVQLQDYRKRWVDSLIKEYEEVGK